MNALWSTLAAEADVTLSPVQLDQLDRYLELLIERNQVINLTRITDRADAEIKHVADALAILKWVPSGPSPLGERLGEGEPSTRRDVPNRKQPKSGKLPPHPNPLPGGKRGPTLCLADVGTGGGIPGAILAIARPDISITLIDSTKKKLDAVKSICDAIGLTNVRTLHTRIEATDERFDVVTARAVAELETLLVWCDGLLKPRGVLIAMKGPRAAEEIERLTPRTRKRWEVETHPATAPQLDGHVTLLCKTK